MATHSDVLAWEIPARVLGAAKNWTQLRNSTAYPNAK